MKVKYIFLTLFILLLFILYIKQNITFNKKIFSCNKTYAANISESIIEIVYKQNNYLQSKSKFITVLSNSSFTVVSLKNIDSENFSLVLIKDTYITNKVIIYNCKILLFSGQCNNKNWYKNSIKYEETIKSVNYGFSIINWHGDGVFHGTVEGLTRIIPYIKFLLNKPNVYIFIPFPRYKQNTAERILLLLGFSKNRILYGKYHVKNMYIPTPFYCIESSTPLITKFNELLRSKILKRNCINSQNNYILVIQRSTNRIIENLNVLKSELIKMFNYSIIIYYDSNKNLDEIYCWFTYAKIIIAYHGSGLTNIYFSKEKTTVIELSPKYPIYAFAKIGCQLGFNYYIYKLPYIKLYIKYIHINISSFVYSLKQIINQ